MNPATLSIITATFPPGRGTAIGIWAGVSALALAIGPLVGGLLSEHADWSWIFFVNIPVGIVAVVAAFLFIDESRDTSRNQRPDVPGLVTSGVGLFALTYGLIEANSYGWGSTRILAAFGLAALSLAAFVSLELRQRRPMLNLTLFRNPTFSGANVSMLLVALAMFGVFFYVSLYMQQILGFSPVEAGASFLPATILIAALAPQMGRLVDRVGSRWLTGSGMTLLALSLLVFSRLGTGSSYWDILPGLVLMGVGMALTMAPTTAAAMSSVPRDQAGVGSAVLNSMRQVGGSLGIAITGAIVAHVSATSLAAGDTRPDAFVHGFQRGLRSRPDRAPGPVVAVATMRRTGAQLPIEEPLCRRPRDGAFRPLGALDADRGPVRRDLGHVAPELVAVEAHGDHRVGARLARRVAQPLDRLEPAVGEHLRIALHLATDQPLEARADVGPDVPATNGEAEHLAVHLGDPVPRQVVHGRDDHVGHQLSPSRRGVPSSRRYPRLRASDGGSGRRRGVRRPDLRFCAGDAAQASRAPHTPMPRRRPGAADATAPLVLRLTVRGHAVAAHRPFGGGTGRGKSRDAGVRRRGRVRPCRR